MECGLFYVFKAYITELLCKQPALLMLVMLVVSVHYIPATVLLVCSRFHQLHLIQPNLPANMQKYVRKWNTMIWNVTNMLLLLSVLLLLLSIKCCHYNQLLGV